MDDDKIFEQDDNLYDPRYKRYLIKILELERNSIYQKQGIKDACVNKIEKILEDYLKEKSHEID